MKEVQLILKDGQPEYAIVPYESYRRLVDEAEMLADIQAYDEARQAVAEGEELVPAELTFAILDGANPIQLWRKHRGLTQAQLAEAAGISKPYLSQLETGKRSGTTAVLQRIAAALEVTLEDIVESSG